MSQSHQSAVTIASRYAEAAFTLAAEAKSETVLVEEMGVVAAAIAADAPLRTALANPLVTRVQKAAILSAIAAKATPLTRRTLGVIAEGGRAEMVPAIAQALGARLSHSRGEIVADVTSARPLSPATQQQLTENLARATGKKLQLRLHQDASLIGGVVIQLGSLRLDASLSGALNHLRAGLLAQTA